MEIETHNSQIWSYLKEVIKNRRSVRDFTNEKIKDEDLNDLIEAGVYAPSGSNAQSQRFMIIKDKNIIKEIAEKRWVWPYKGKKKKLRENRPYGLIGKASALIIVFCDSRKTLQSKADKLYYVWEELEIQNCAASIQNILLAATSKKIGSCWISFNSRMSYTRLLSQKSLNNLFKNYNVPHFLKPQAIIALGYPRNLCELGYPKGELYHGTTLNPVERKPINKYLINLEELKISRFNINLIDKFLLKLISITAMKLTNIIGTLQILAAKIEFKNIKKL